MGNRRGLRGQGCCGLQHCFERACALGFLQHEQAPRHAGSMIGSSDSTARKRTWPEEQSNSEACKCAWKQVIQTTRTSAQRKAHLWRGSSQLTARPASWFEAKPSRRPPGARRACARPL
jgi:hypothetical protein